MKVLAFVTGLLISASSFAAVQDGTYTCVSDNNRSQATYKIATLNVSGIALTVLELTRTITISEDNVVKSETYTAKGVATLFSNGLGEEVLALGSYRVELTAGRPSCVK